MEGSTSDIALVMPERTPNFTSKMKAPSSLLGVATTMCQTPLFFTKTLTIQDIQLQ
jgi:hypothetical protein